jgi:hypothetical protein
MSIIDYAQNWRRRAEEARLMTPQIEGAASNTTKSAMRLARAASLRELPVARLERDEVAPLAAALPIRRLTM